MTCECRFCAVILTRISDTCQGLYPYWLVRVQTFVFPQKNHNALCIVYLIANYIIRGVRLAHFEKYFNQSVAAIDEIIV